MLRFIRWCSIVWPAARPRSARAGARHLSRPAGPVRRRLPAGRRDRHVLPADLQRTRHRARPVGRDREQGRRRRLHRLADGRAARRPTATRVLVAENAHRHQPGAVQEASVRLRSAASDYDAVGAMAQHAAGVDRRQQRPRQQLRRIRGVVEDRAGQFQLRPRRPRQRVASGARGHSRRRRHAGRAACRSRAADRRRRRSPAASSPWSCPPCRSPRRRSKASSSKACS